MLPRLYPAEKLPHGENQHLLHVGCYPFTVSDWSTLLALFSYYRTRVR